MSTMCYILQSSITTGGVRPGPTSRQTTEVSSDRESLIRYSTVMLFPSTLGVSLTNSADGGPTSYIKHDLIMGVH